MNIYHFLDGEGGGGTWTLHWKSRKIPKTKFIFRLKSSETYLELVSGNKSYEKIYPLENMKIYTL